jgi:NAD(P)-dependent dehydrogenase (short-subunit alcohol dehydrogenase family)
MDLQLTGKRAIVTGGSRGIGKAIARALAGEGCDVVVIARGEELLRAAAAELAAETGRAVTPVVCDTSSDESTRAGMRAAIAALGGGVDILVNCAATPSGQAAPAMLADVHEDNFWPDMNVKVLGYLRTAREVAPLMAAQNWGRIINISGLGARQTGAVLTSMRNASVAALTKNLADELGPQGINVTVVHPGLTRTEATPGVIRWRAETTGRSEAEIERQMSEANTVRRIIDAEDIAVIVAFLASPLSVAITGDAIAAGGGAPRAIYY